MTIVVTNEQTAKTLANVEIFDIQESFRGSLNESVTLIKNELFAGIVLIYLKPVKVN